MTRLRAGDPEVEDRRAAHVEHLEEFVWRGSYEIPAPEIAAALLLEAGRAWSELGPVQAGRPALLLTDIRGGASPPGGAGGLVRPG